MSQLSKKACGLLVFWILKKFDSIMDYRVLRRPLDITSYRINHNKNKLPLLPSRAKEAIPKIKTNPGETGITSVQFELPKYLYT
jgi:hypothetical protein